MQESRVVVDGQSLTLDEVVLVARSRTPVVLAEDAKARMIRARDLIERKARGQEAVYGLNTGFGALKNVRIPPEDLAALQVNLIRSHCVGVGPRLLDEEVRALMLLRANTMATGRSGVRVSTVQMVLDMLNAGIHPVIPSKGSVGASGDLAPLAHTALAMLGEGRVVVDGTEQDSLDALRRAGLEPLSLQAKEGLGLVNGTQAMTALGALAVRDAEDLCFYADVIGGASVEGFRGTPVAFDPRIQAVRPHPGQEASAGLLRACLEGSLVVESHKDCDSVQDPYSFRCMPQVHGASRDVVAFVRQTLEREINSGTDNPLVFAEPGEGDALLSGGNFHGQPIALALDFLAMAVSELANISDRRVEQLLDPKLSGHPPFLVQSSGLNSGFMMAQVTAASLVNENRVLCTPASVDSIPTSANQEDHVSMGMTSARKVREIVRNTRYCLAIELLCACQALDLIGLSPGLGVRAAYQSVRSEIPVLERDRTLHVDIEACAKLLETGALRTAVESALRS